MSQMVDISAGRRQARARRYGFTLIEVLISLVILSTGIVVVLRALGMSLTAVHESHNRLWAEMVISDRIAEIKASALENGVEAIKSMSGEFESLHGFSGDCRIDLVESLPEKPGQSDGYRIYRVTIAAWNGAAPQKRYPSTSYMGINVPGKDVKP